MLTYISEFCYSQLSAILTREAAVRLYRGAKRLPHTSTRLRLAAHDLLIDGSFPVPSDVRSTFIFALKSGKPAGKSLPRGSVGRGAGGKLRRLKAGLKGAWDILRWAVVKIPWSEEAELEVRVYQAAVEKEGGEGLVGPMELVAFNPDSGITGREVKNGIAMPHYSMTLAQVRGWGWGWG